MPTYEYVCDACEHAFDEFQSMTADPLETCPSCGKDELRRLIGIGAGIIFKGSGFYETDYRSESYKKSQKADSEAAKPPASTESKSESSKPENKTSSASSSNSAPAASQGSSSSAADA